VSTTDTMICTTFKYICIWLLTGTASAPLASPLPVC
jgi:hypothetical protein